MYRQPSRLEHITISMDRNALRDLKTFQTTSFAAFLHYTLELVDAVPRRQSLGPTVLDDFQEDIKLCLQLIIEIMDDKENSLLIQSITDGLDDYCKERRKVDQREALVKAINAALVLLQPLSIGNSKAAVHSNTDDFPFFLAQKHTMKENKRVPDIFCTTRKHANTRSKDCQDADREKVLQDISSPLEWRHCYSCWEIMRSSGQLNITQPAPSRYYQCYPSIPVREYGHTVNKHPLNAERCAEDAAKMFYDTLGRDHIMNVAINDSLLRVWYFDHECPIQTSAFNFIEDLPYFLLFLFALQRFSRSDWGFIDYLSAINSDQSEVVDISDAFFDNQGTQRETTFSRVYNGDNRYSSFTLCGRSTHVVFGDVNHGGTETAAVLKLSWREKHRVPEGTFLQEAIKRLHEINCVDACEYIPTLLAEKSFPALSTDIIRQRLMIPVSDVAVRLPYFVVLPKYEPLVTRTTDWTAFLEDYLELIYCHLTLWSVGIQHADISDRNLMWDPATKKPKLCDFDLSYFSDRLELGFKNTGTPSFMAYDLLTANAMEGLVKRRYRHDLESFVAVLVWIVICCDNGAISNEDALKEWRSPSFAECAAAREKTYQNLYFKGLEHILTKGLKEVVTILVHRCQRVSQRSRSLQESLDFASTGMHLAAIPEEQDEYEKDNQELQKLNSIGVVTDIVHKSLTNPLTHPLVSDSVKAILRKIRDFLETQADVILFN